MTISEGYRCLAHSTQRLRLPLGPKIIQAETDLLTVETQAKLWAFASNLKDNPLPQERVVISEAFIDAANLVDNAVRIAMKICEGITVSMNQALPEDRRIDEGKTRSLADRIRPIIDGQMNQEIRLRA